MAKAVKASGARTAKRSKSARARSTKSGDVKGFGFYTSPILRSDFSRTYLGKIGGFRNRFDPF